MEQFAKLGLSSEVLSVLKLEGFEKPTEIQEKATPLAIAGHDIIGSSATGSGKTLVFASPIMENLKPSGKVQALILTPTRELAEQVATAISLFSRNKHLGVLAIYGGMSMSEQIRKIPRKDVIVGTPGRILDHLSRGTLRLDDVKFLVLDEVDRMFDMGFHKDVEMIIRNCPEERQTMLFSATISPEVDYLARKYTKDAVEVSAKSFVDHSKLKQVYYDVEKNEKFSLLVHLLKKQDSQLTMIFCSTRRNADFVADNLYQAGIKARAIHGGLVQNKRLNLLREFHEKKFSVLVCTDVAARGLDIKGVSHVYNYDLPKESADYVHRIGRTARAGEDGKVVNILASHDYDNFSNILRKDTIKIEKEETPEFENIFVKMDRGERGNFRGGREGNFRGGRDSSPSGNRNFRRDDSGSGREGNRERSFGGGRRNFRSEGNGRSRDSGREGNFRSRGRSYSRR